MKKRPRVDIMWKLYDSTVVPYMHGGGGGGGGGCSSQKTQKNPKKPKKTQSQFTGFGVATGFFWDFLGFFWFNLGFFGFFWLEISDALKFGKQLFVGIYPCFQ